jgi:4-amino-4-deoxy-L-arabinose transferase-like glycosyltransferase
MTAPEARPSNLPPLRGSFLIHALTSLTLLGAALGCALFLFLTLRSPLYWMYGLIMGVTAIVALAIALRGSSARRPQRLSSASFLAAALGGALALQLVWLAAFPAEPIVDFYFYHHSPRWFLEHGAFTDETGALYSYRPPGYTIFLVGLYSLVGHRVGAAIGANVVAFLATIALTFFALRSWCGERAARLATWMLILAPESLGASGLVATENLATLGLLGSAVVTTAALREPLRYGRLVAGATLLGLAAYVRPNGVPLVGAVYISLYALRYSWKHVAGGTAAFLVVLALIIYPWMLRNERAFGMRVFSTQIGVNLYAAYHENMAGVFRLAKEFERQYPDPLEAYRRGVAAAGDFVREHPFLSLRNVAWHFYYLTARNDEIIQSTMRALTNRRFAAAEGVLGSISSGTYYAWVFAALVGVWRLRLFDRHPRLCIAGGTFVLYLWASSLLLTEPRYHFVVFPFLVMLAAASLAELGARRPAAAARA